MSERDVVSDIQRLLTERGLNPGPADGIAGRRTRQAIVEFQRDAGLPVDGLPTPGLRDYLLDEPVQRDGGTAGAGEVPSQPAAIPVPPSAQTPPAAEETSTPNSVQPAATAIADPAPETASDPAAAAPDEATAAEPEEPAPPSLTDTAWRIVDGTGSESRLTLVVDGMVEGVLYKKFWTWQQSGEDVIITYDNGMGLKVKRSGTLTGPDAMSGTAQPSRGQPWNWTAERISGAPPVSSTAE